jgi:hypothetical protein
VLLGVGQIRINKLDFPRTQVYFNTQCDGLKCVDSIAGVRDNAQTHNRCTLFTANRYGIKFFVWPMAAITKWERPHLKWGRLSETLAIAIKDVIQVVYFI